MPPRANELKIVSYNIRWRSGKEIQQIIRWLKEAASSRPTIIGLQEVDRREGAQRQRESCQGNRGQFGDALRMDCAA